MSFYIAHHNDLVIRTAHVGRTTPPKVYRVEFITTGKTPVGMYDTSGGFYKVSDDDLVKYTGDDYDQIAKSFPDISPLARGTLLYFPDGTGGQSAHKLWTVTDMAGSGLYSIALLGGGAARRGYPRRGLPAITLAEATDHLVNNRA